MENQEIENQKTETELRKFLISKKLKPNKCQVCGLKNKHNGKNLKLWVDRINRDTYDLSLDNLRLICPNCYSQEYHHNPFQDIRDEEEQDEETDNNQEDEEQKEPEEKKFFKVTECSFCKKKLKEVAILSRLRNVFCKRCESAGLDFNIESSYQFMKFKDNSTESRSYLSESKKDLKQEFPDTKSINELCSKLTKNRKYHENKIEKDSQERFKKKIKKPSKDLDLGVPKVEEIEPNQESEARLKHQEEYRQEEREKREMAKKEKEKFLEKNPGYKYTSDEKEAKEFTKDISRRHAQKEWKKKQEVNFIDDDSEEDNHQEPIEESLEMEIIEDDIEDEDSDDSEDEKYQDSQDENSDEDDDDNQDNIYNGKVIEEEFEC